MTVHRPRVPPPRDAEHAVRLIGGRLRRSKLPVLSRPGLRPTPDRVRETLFNWLGQDLTGWRVLDAFAGTGALGLEAVSRGAAEAVLIERDAAAAASLRSAVARLDAQQARVVVAEALGWMASAAPGTFDLICLDPPFDAGLHAAAVRAATRLLAPDGLLYVECGAPWPPAAAAAPGLSVWRQGRAGAVHFFLLRPTTLTANDEEAAS